MAKNFWPSPEVVNPSTIYELSLAPNDKLQFFDYKDRLKKFTKQNHLLLYKLMKDYRGHLNIECSRHGRLHFHGYITFPNIDEIKQFYLYTVHSLEDQYTCAMNPYRQEEWDKYISKQSKFEWGKICFEEDPDDPHDMKIVKRKTKQLNKLLDLSDESDN